MLILLKRLRAVFFLLPGQNFFSAWYIDGCLGDGCGLVYPLEKKEMIMDLEEKMCSKLTGRQASKQAFIHVCKSEISENLSQPHQTLILNKIGMMKKKMENDWPCNGRSRISFGLVHLKQRFSYKYLR